MAKKESLDEFEDIDLNNTDETASRRSEKENLSNNEITTDPARQKLIEDIQVLQSSIEILREMYKEAEKLINTEISELESNSRGGYYKGFKESKVINIEMAFRIFKNALDDALSSSNDDLNKFTDDELSKHKEKLVSQCKNVSQKIYTAAETLEANTYIQQSHLARKNKITHFLSKGLSTLFGKLNKKFPNHFPDPVPNFLKTSAQRTMQEIKKKTRPKPS